MISPDAAIVFELTDIGAFKRKLENFPNLKKAINQNSTLSQIIASNFFQNSKTYLVAQSTSRDNFEFLVYSEISSPNKRANFLELSKNLLKDRQLKKRVYNGYDIYEHQELNKAHFSFAIIEEIAVVSGSPFLLEGAIRLKTGNQKELFKNANPSLFKLPTLQSDEGNVYVNVSNFFEAIKLFIGPDPLKNKFSISGSSLSDIKVDEDRVLMNGFVLNSPGDALSLFTHQKPQPIDVESLVSNQTAAFIHFGISNPAIWFDDQEILKKARGITSTDSLKHQLRGLSIEIGSVQKSIGNQFANCYLRDGDSQVSILKLKEGADQVSVFDELASKISVQRKDSLYVENYAGYQIKLIDYKDFLYQLLYPLAPPAEQTYFVQIRQYLIFSENVELIKLFIDDIDDENTWGKSVEWTKFLNSSLQESNLNLFFDGRLLSVFLKADFNAKWKPFFDSTNFLGIERGAAQLSRLESNFYLNATLQFSGQQPKPAGNLVSITREFGSNITAPVKVVKSHVSKDHEIMIQDSTGNIYLLSNNLKILWTHPVTHQIVDGIKQVDFFANGKLQYFFTSGTAIHIVDRLGRVVDGFPRTLGQINVEYSVVVDYDRSKRYRYLLTDVKGNLYLADKTGALLEGWSPRSFAGRMFAPARHYRILGKDYFIAVQQTGTVSLMNRRGETVRGFPMELGFRPAGNFALTAGSTLSSSYFTVVSPEGIQVQFGLDGQIKKREVLLKRTGSSQFALVKSSDESSFVFLRSDPGRLAIVEPEGKTLLEVENRGSTKWQLTYIENRLKDRFYCLYDPIQNFSYIYDTTGSLILAQPLESTQPPTLFFDEKTKSLLIYNVFENRLSLVEIKR